MTIAAAGFGTAAYVGIGIAVVLVVALLALSVRVVRPTHRGLVERLGRYRHYSNAGVHLIIPFVDRMYRVDVRETLVEAQPQEIITNDNLNAKVDAQVYLKVRADEESVKASQYNVSNYQTQVVNLSRTTLRNIIGTLTLKSANSERGKINDALRSTLRVETANWGIEILRTELKEIDPPHDVQETMNKVVKAENEKISAVDFATAAETQADGLRRAEIKKAEGKRQGRILEAEGEAEAIKLVNEAAQQYFVGNAQVLRKLEAVEKALWQNTTVVVPADGELVNVIGDLAGVTPLRPSAHDGHGAREVQQDGSHKRAEAA
jgi:regulator of protease activity HflC (stomatin/prohibitin superfamily)